MAFHYSPKIVTDGLVLYIDMANNRSFVTGSTYSNDISKSSTLITYKNKVYNGGTGDVVTIVSPTYDANNGGSIYLSGGTLTGTGGYLPDNETITNLTDYLTLSVWFKKNVYDTYLQCFASKGFNTPSGGSQAYGISLINNSISFRLTTTTTTGLTDILTTFEINVWNNIVATYDGSTMNLYLNGELKSSSPKTGPIMNSIAPFNIGCQSNAGYYPSNASVKTGDFFKGYISNVNLYNRGLSDKEVLKNYNTLKSRFGL